jgi:hypothetical protein
MEPNPEGFRTLRVGMKIGISDRSRLKPKRRTPQYNRETCTLRALQVEDPKRTLQNARLSLHGCFSPTHKD